MRGWIVIIAAVLAAAVATTLYAELQIRGAVERAGLRTLGLPIHYAQLRPAWDGGIALRLLDVRIPQPEGFGSEPMVQVAEVRLTGIRLTGVRPTGVRPTGVGFGRAAPRLRVGGLVLESPLLRVKLRRDAINLLWSADNLAHAEAGSAPPREHWRGVVAVRSPRLVADLGPRYGRAGQVNQALADGATPIAGGISAEALVVAAWAALMETTVAQGAHYIPPPVRERLRQELFAPDDNLDTR